MKSNWTIEYELPPLRAIYSFEIDGVTEAEAVAKLEQKHPSNKVTVRKVVKK